MFINVCKRITQIFRGLQDRVVEFLVQLQVCVRMGVCVIHVLGGKCGRGRRLGTGAPKGMHR